VGAEPGIPEDVLYPDVTVRESGKTERKPETGICSSGVPRSGILHRILDTGSKVYLTNEIRDVRIPPSSGKVVKGNVWVRVFDNYYTVSGDTFRFRW